MAGADAGLGEGGARHGRVEIGEPVGEAGRVGAAPHRLAMRVEQHQLDVGQIVAAQQLADAHTQPLDPVGRGELADIAS